MVIANPHALLWIVMPALLVGCWIMLKLLPDLLELFAWPIGAALVGLIVWELIGPAWFPLNYAGAVLAVVLVLGIGWKG